MEVSGEVFACSAESAKVETDSPSFEGGKSGENGKWRGHGGCSVCMHECWRVRDLDRGEGGGACGTRRYRVGTKPRVARRNEPISAFTASSILQKVSARD